MVAVGRENVFKDIDSIEIGEKFVEKTTKAIDSSDVVLAIIGNSWLDMQDEAGKQRLRNRDNFVRVELETALKKKKRIIPVSVQQTSMPSESRLPDSLRPLTHFNAAEVRSGRYFEKDINRLCRAIGRRGRFARLLVFLLLFAALGGVLYTALILNPGNPPEEVGTVVRDTEQKSTVSNKPLNPTRIAKGEQYRNLRDFADKVLDTIEASGGSIGLEKRLLGAGLKKVQTAEDWVRGARREALAQLLRPQVKSWEQLLARLCKNKLGAYWYIQFDGSQPVRLLDWVKEKHNFTGPSAG